MGVYWSFYVILGYELDAEKYNDWMKKRNIDYDVYEKYINGSPGVNCRLIEDTMCGTYAFFGKVLYSAHQHDTNPPGLIENQNSDERIEVMNEFKKLFGDDMKLATKETKGIPKIIAFEHQS